MLVQVYAKTCMYLKNILSNTVNVKYGLYTNVNSYTDAVYNI